ncbi:MAG TPA: DUF4488 domain-containing protein [Bacteroidetes bacterium]|nr:DUF4488 domain-containing protein [Bacteroidota bacterium]
MFCARHLRRSLPVLILAGLLVWQLSCEKKRQVRPGPFCGAWKMISGTYKGPNFTVQSTEENRLSYKVISQDHFAVVEMFKSNPDSMLFTAVGRYTYDDSTYTEFYEATNVPYQTGTKNIFRYKLEGNRWILDMKTEDMELHEVWERIQ